MKVERRKTLTRVPGVGGGSVAPHSFGSTIPCERICSALYDWYLSLLGLQVWWNERSTSASICDRLSTSILTKPRPSVL